MSCEQYMLPLTVSAAFRRLRQDQPHEAEESGKTVPPFPVEPNPVRPFDTQLPGPGGCALHLTRQDIE